MNNPPIIFNIKYTTYRPRNGASAAEKEKHEKERKFYDLTGDYTIYDYVTEEEKIKPLEEEKPEDGKKQKVNSSLDYFNKMGTGVFNDKGMISKEELKEMKERAKNNKGNIWHGFISLNEEESHKIDTPEKCINLIKQNFPTFLKEGHFDKDNIDLMCGLHTDRPHHLHIHFSFWEKEPKYKDSRGNQCYRQTGDIWQRTIDNFKLRLLMYLDDAKDKLYMSRNMAINELKEINSILYRKMKYGDEYTQNDFKKIMAEIIQLSKELPESGRTSYNSKNMDGCRDHVDKIVNMLLAGDKTARKADLKFYEEWDERKKRITDTFLKMNNLDGKKKSNGNKITSDNTKSTDLEGLRRSVNEVFDDISDDYKSRQGNKVIELAKKVKNVHFEREPNVKYRASDNHLKRKLAISRRDVSKLIKGFMRLFGDESEKLSAYGCNRLQQIEKEIEMELKNKEQAEIQKLKQEEENSSKGENRNE